MALSVRVGCLLLASLSMPAFGCGASRQGAAPLPPDPCIAAGTCPPGVWIDVTPGVPTELVIGPNSVVVTNDGTNSVFVGLMWGQGLWRYVEP